MRWWHRLRWPRVPLLGIWRRSAPNVERIVAGLMSQNQDEREAASHDLFMLDADRLTPADRIYLLRAASWEYPPAR